MRIRSIGPSALVLTALACYPQSAHAAEPAPSRGAVGGFLDLEWRAMGLGGHLSHGGAFAAGVTLLEGHLRLGVAGLGRPGPWNPTTFDVTLPEGRTYRGKRRLSLRSDGGMAGAHVALAARATLLARDFRGERQGAVDAELCFGGVFLLNDAVELDFVHDASPLRSLRKDALVPSTRLGRSNPPLHLLRP